MRCCEQGVYRAGCGTRLFKKRVRFVDPSLDEKVVLRMAEQKPGESPQEPFRRKRAPNENILKLGSGGAGSSLTPAAPTVPLEVLDTVFEVGGVMLPVSAWCTQEVVFVIALLCSCAVIKSIVFT